MPILLSVMFWFNTNAIAQDQANVQNEPPETAIEKWIPDLSDAQKTEIKKLRTAHLKEIQQLKNQMEIKRAELKALQTAEKPDMDAINKKIDERAALRVQIEKEAAAHKQAVRTVLTEDQRVIYDSKTNRSAKGQSGCGHKPGEGCGNAQKANCKH
jgi:Spy/CpxP family protein refolding chaperone